MKTLTLCVLSLFYFMTVLGQTEQPGTFQDLINVDTKSPDAAALGKFGNIPVNYCTGSTSISIPVFHIDIGKIHLPISLDYHTGGVRVDESSSSVGLGWALSGIGIVSRNVVNIPDDGDGGYLSSPPPDSLYTDWAYGGGQYGAAVDTYYASWLNTFREGGAETDPDIYSYNITGESGKFIIQRNLQIMQMPLSNNQIVQVGGGFQITDANGVIYIFDLPEHVEVPTPDLTRIYVGTWRLTKIVDPGLADTVFFSYNGTCGVSTDHLYSYYYNMITPGECANLASSGEQFHISTTNRMDEQFPSQISWRGGMIQFSNACDRSDRVAEMRLDHIGVYSVVHGQQQLVKTVQLSQSYFYTDMCPGYSSTDERNYRLRLDSVRVLPTSGSLQPQTWRMTYNNGNMASRESVAQDMWGFNNGKFNNTSSLPAQNVTYNSVIYPIGINNSRDADANAMQVCMLNSIQYPTGGKSVFQFEPHQWLTYNNYTEPETTPCSADSRNQSSSQITWTPDPLGSAYNVTYYFSAYNDQTGITDRPRVIITDQTTGTQLTINSNSDPSQPLSTLQNPVSWNPVLGHTYLIQVNLYTTTATNVNAQFYINWTRTYTNVPKINIGGGLRVKSVTNYDLNGAVTGKDLYAYGLTEDGNGQLLTPANYLQVASRAIQYACAVSDGSDPGSGGVGCQTTYGAGLTVYANPVFPATQFSGSPVLYPSVTKYQLDAQGYPSNGKSIFTYGNLYDQPAFATTNYQKYGVLMILNDWKNGYLYSQSDYKYDLGTSTYELVKTTTNDMEPVRGATYNGVKVENSSVYLQDECNINSMVNATTQYFMAQVPTNTGAMLSQSKTVTTYGTNGTPLTVTENYTYGDLTHLFPTIKATVDSKNIAEVTNLKYPHDFASGNNVYAGMVAKNIISPLIQSQRLYNNVQADLHNVNYQDWSGTGNLLLPASVDEQIRSNPLETRILFNQYDKYGNILQQQKTGDIYQSYIWDYDSTYPIAKVVNAGGADIAATSFEADGTGGIYLDNNGAGIISTDGITGSHCFQINEGLAKFNLDPTKTYIVSMWAKNGTPNYNGFNGSTMTVATNNAWTTGKTINGWTYLEKSITGVTTINVGSGGGLVDEVRFYPANAQMMTYTYAPLVGMTTQCDEDNRITYYEYDEMGRLRDVKDQDGNVIKTYDYHYHAN